MRMTIQRLTRPALPLDLVATRDHLRIVGDHDDTSLIEMTEAAAHELEEAAEIALITQTIRVTVEGWPDSDRLRLPIGPVLGDNPTFQVMAEGELIEAELIGGTRPVLVLGETVTEYLHHARFVIEYEAGFGATPEALPPDIRHAIRDQVAALYDFRGANAHEAKTPQARGTSSQSYAMQRAIGRYRGVKA
ncbi:hypothetical protein [Roseinatronobacter bogoriensis]|nr:hypothetical protein [Rhodobaca]MBB4209159.1 hypothetical protein [Rhodobaca bogoriensis DSM 18756]TDW36313.1 putative phiE125 gp8 family phage protein [Rhodobaca barguzinensis]TDY67559.1 putative phiE125 gp8 family phage protein [Rhodobaca bogoriensis DSM 18756]